MDLIFKPSFEKDLKKISKPFSQKIIDKVFELKNNPFPIQSKKLKGMNGLYRLRVGDYRVVYQIHSKVIIILGVGHRQGVYNIL